MDEKEYQRQLGEIYQYTGKKLEALQKELTMEEALKFRFSMDFFWIEMISACIGEEALMHYLIDLLNSVSKIQWKKERMGEKQFKRYTELREKG